MASMVQIAVFGTVMMVGNCHSCASNPGEDQVAPEFGCVLSGAIEAELVDFAGGCRDVMFFAADQGFMDGAKVAVRFDHPGAASEASAAESPLAWVRQLPDAEMSVIVETGDHLADFYCNDAANGPKVVDETFTAVSGEAALVIEPEVPRPQLGPIGNGSLELTRVVLESDLDPARRVYLDCDIADQFVGSPR